MKFSFSSPHASLPGSKSFSSTGHHSPKMGYQDLFETLGVSKNTKERKLPASLKDLKDFTRNEKKALPDLGHPVARKDAQMLIKWLDNMLSQVASNTDSIESVLENALSIYEVCFHEVVRQVSVQCKERGDLISRIWKAYISLLDRALKISQASQLSQLQQFKQEKENIRTATSSEILKLRSEVDEKSLDILSYIDKVTIKENEITKLGIINKRLMHRLEIIRAHYETVKKENVDLKEENRILKGKLLNTQTEFVINAHGVIEAQLKRMKIKRKSKDALVEIVTKDPIISYGNSVDITEQESLNADISNHEKELTEIFQQADFCDTGNDAPEVILETKETETELGVSCGFSIGEAKEPVVVNTMMIELLELKIESLIADNQESKELARMSTIRLQELESIVKATGDNEKIQSLMEKFKNSGLARAPTGASPKGIAKDTISDFKHETKRLKTIRKRMWTVIQASRLKKSSEISTMLLQKIKNTPLHKLKKVIVKKILMKFISTFYDTKLIKRAIDSENSRKQDVSQHVYEVVSNKFGPGKIAETKFTQIASSCMKYKHIKRVKVFGRFLKLYDDFDNEDLEVFLDFLQFFKNSTSKEFNNSEYADQVLIPYEKALELFKSNLLQKLTERDRKDAKIWLENNKISESFNKFQLIDQDAYLEVLIEKFRSKKSAKVNFMKCIYEAADLNDDGYLQQVEFDLLARHLSTVPVAEGFTSEIFNEFAETFTDENEHAVQALSFENFAILNNTYEVFSVDSLHAFSKISNDQGAIWHIKQVAPHIDIILKEIHWRLSLKDNWREYEDEYNLVLSVIKNKILSQKNPESVWIALRLLQEESKGIVIEKTLKSFLPSIQALVITSTNIL